jgi:hypothetical protein
MSTPEMRGEMPYGVLGRTGERVSALGIGGWHIRVAALNEALLDLQRDGNQSASPRRRAAARPAGNAAIRAELCPPCMTA